MQNPTNHDFCETVDWFDFNGPDSNDSEGQMKNEAFDSLDHDKSSHENVSPNDFQNGSLQNAQGKGKHLIDHNYCSELRSFHCNFCDTESWFDCVCSDSNDDSEEKSKIEKVEKEVKEKPKNFVCNFNECEASYTTKNGLKFHINSKHLNLKLR